MAGESYFNGISNLNSGLQNSSENLLLAFVMYGSENLAFIVNREIIRLTTDFLKDSEHFVEPLFWQKKTIYFCYWFIPFINSFATSFYLISYCTWFTVTEYILLEFCILFIHLLYLLFLNMKKEYKQLVDVGS